MTVITGGTVLTFDPERPLIEDGALIIEGDRIAAVGTSSEIGELQAKKSTETSEHLVIDARGGLVMPGMTNAHTHFYSAFARGIQLRDQPPANFVEILERLWWRLDQALTDEDVYYSALVSAIDCIKNGTTAVLDHHSSPNAIEGSLDLIARAAREVGLRASLCYEVSDRDGPEAASRAIRENLRFASACRQRRGEEGEFPLLVAAFGLHASFTLSDSTLDECRDAGKEAGTGYHIHAAEDLADVERTAEVSGKRVIERLADFQILGETSIAAHCVHLNANEIDLLAKTGTIAVHNAESNMANAVGTADVPRMLSSGVLLGLGTDGYTADMFEAVKVTNLLQKHAGRNPSAGWEEVPRMAFDNNRRIFSRLFGAPLCTLQKGALADVIILDYDPPTPVTPDNYYSHILFGLSGGLVDTVFVGGRPVMRDRELTGVDEGRIRAAARQRAKKLWERF